MPIKFSVIMPFYNASKTIKEAIQSVLNQLSSADELIAIDDGSTDDSRAIVESFKDERINLFVMSKNSGIGAARNEGLRHITGDYVGFMDADDLWPAGRHQAILDCINEHQPDILSGMLEHFYCLSLSEQERARYLLPEIQPGQMPGTVILKQELVKQVGEFDTQLKVGEFIDFMSRAKATGAKIVNCDVLFLRRRIHGQNHTLRHKQQQLDYIKVVRRHIQRVSG